MWPADGAPVVGPEEDPAVTGRCHSKVDRQVCPATAAGHRWPGDERYAPAAQLHPCCMARRDPTATSPKHGRGRLLAQCDAESLAPA
jgi:hypothetical protein